MLSPFRSTETGRGQRLGRASCVLVIAACTWLAYRHRFVQDDAFISFRYAKHLQSGVGWEWNPGERVQGFTNPLWTVLIAGALALGRSPVGAAYALGLVCFTGTLVATLGLVRALGGNRAHALACAAIVGTNYSLSCYATGGLETSSQVCVLTFVALLFARSFTNSERSSAGLGWAAATGLAVATRLDSLVIVAPLTLALLLHDLRGRRNTLGGSLLRWAFPAMAVLLGLLAFNRAYFGDALPNTFYAKTGGTTLPWGLSYVTSFLSWYGAWPFVFILVFSFLRWVVESRWWDVAPAMPKNGAAPDEKEHVFNGRLAALVLVVFAWLAYVVSVGGDFMEYRFIVPILPVFAATVTTVLRGLRPEISLALGLTAVLASLNYEATVAPQASIPGTLGVETVHSVQSHIEEPAQAWPEVGSALGRELADLGDVSLGVSAAGALCYYSDLRCIDLLGLNDRSVARWGETIGDRPGHRRMASLRYLVERQVNFVVSPWMVGDPRNAEVSFAYDELTPYVVVDPSTLPASSMMVEIPIRSGRTLRVLYLVVTERISRRIEERHWRTWPIHRAWRGARE